MLTGVKGLVLRTRVPQCPNLLRVTALASMPTDGRKARTRRMRLDSIPCRVTASKENRNPSGSVRFDCSDSCFSDVPRLDANDTLQAIRTPSVFLCVCRHHWHGTRTPG